MALDDRDWYREEPSQAWLERRRDVGAPAGDQRQLPARHGLRRTRRVVLWLAAGAVLGVLVGFAMDDRFLVSDAVRHAPDAAAQVRTPAPTDSSLIRLGARPALDVPVARVTRWRVRTRSGVVVVYVPIGKSPREALTIALAERGFQVVESNPYGFDKRDGPGGG